MRAREKQLKKSTRLESCLQKIKGNSNVKKSQKVNAKTYAAYFISKFSRGNIKQLKEFYSEKSVLKLKKSAVKI